MAECTIGKELKQSTCRYVKNCKPGYIRNDKFICRKTARRVNPDRLKTKGTYWKKESPDFNFEEHVPKVYAPHISPNFNVGAENGSAEPIITAANFDPNFSRHVKFNVNQTRPRTSPPRKQKPGTLPLKRVTLGNHSIHNSYELSLPLADRIREKRRQTIKGLKSMGPSRKRRRTNNGNVQKQFIKSYKDDLPVKRFRVPKGPGFAFNDFEENYKSGAHLNWDTRRRRANNGNVQKQFIKSYKDDLPVKRFRVPTGTSKAPSKRKAPSTRKAPSKKNTNNGNVQKQFMKSYKDDLPVKRFRVPTGTSKSTKQKQSTKQRSINTGNVQKQFMKSYKDDLPVKRFRVPKGPGFAFNDFEENYKSGAHLNWDTRRKRSNKNKP